MNQVVEHAMQTVRPLVEHHRHEMVFNRSPMLVWCNADPTRLEEIFANLLNNAIKYTPDGGRIEVWCEHRDGSNFAQVRVRDNGMGIDEKLLPRIFDLFTQADRSLARSAGGLGIGLSLAQRLVDLHGGTIQAHSPPQGSDAPGIGSEFIVRLPSVAAPDMPPPVEPNGSRMNADGLRVLIVDDNIDFVMMLATTLRLRGHTVESAYTGLDGLHVARQWEPDMVILDIGLPGLDGYEVAKRLRDDVRNRGDSVGGFRGRLIAVTGYGRDVDIDLARVAGFDAHLTKPFDFKELEKLMAVHRD